jgi:hypothetical protein
VPRVDLGSVDGQVYFDGTHDDLTGHARITESDSQIVTSGSNDGKTITGFVKLHGTIARTTLQAVAAMKDRWTDDSLYSPYFKPDYDGGGKQIHLTTVVAYFLLLGNISWAFHRTDFLNRAPKYRYHRDRTEF